MNLNKFRHVWKSLKEFREFKEFWFDWVLWTFWELTCTFRSILLSYLGLNSFESCFYLPFSPPAHNWFFWSTVSGVPVHFLLAIFTLSFLSFLVSTLFLSSIARVNSRPNSNVFPHPLTTANLSSFKDLVKWSWDQGRQTGVTDDLAF